MACGSYFWLRTGDEAFAMMLNAIDEAMSDVRLEMYIFSAGQIGEHFRTALERACARGVRVRVMLDAFGSYGVGESFWAPVVRAGGEFKWFNPLNFKRWTFRNHRKLLVCDLEKAFIGGFNVASEYEGDGVTRGWRDLGMGMTGPLVKELAVSFDTLFEMADRPHRVLTRLRKTALRSRVLCPDGDLLLSAPGRGRNAISRALLLDFAEAKRIRIVSAYFLPTVRIRRALVRAVRRGVQVQLVLPARSDVKLAQMASRSFYTRLMRAGVEIYEYQPQILHSKLVVTDSAVYVGSSNLDSRSLHINYELMVRLVLPETIREADAAFEDHLAHSIRVQFEAWRSSRTLWHRVRDRLAYFILARLDPFLMRQQLRNLRPYISRRGVAGTKAA
ncbi:MAG: hypothetical protein GX456_03320 [Verrucomicrobia bacterium]|nr:hypothetical protein [Verrucomicrobiota bacterium]